MDVDFLFARQHELRLPKSVKDKALVSFVSSQPNGPHRPRENAPFQKMYDFWFASILWAEHHDLEPIIDTKSVKFIAVGPTDADTRLENWMLELLLLIAVCRLQPDVNTLPDASDVFKLANELAVAGAQPLLDRLQGTDDLMEPSLYTTVELFRETAGCGKESPRAGR